MQTRYGVNPKRSRTLAWVTVVGIIALAVGGTLAYRATHHVVSFRLLAFNVVSPHRVDVTLEVAQAQQTQSYCVLRAQNEQRQDVGYATVAIPSGQTDLTYTYPLSTESTAVVAEVLNCSTSTRMRVPPANFPPGVKIPQQSPPGVAPNAE